MRLLSVRPTIALTSLLVLLLYAAPLLLGAPLTDPDEGLHAAIAQEMHERGEAIVPSFLGRPFLDKPILFFWTQLASIEVFGMSAAAVRLPGLVFAMLGVFTTGWLAAALYGRRDASSSMTPAHALHGAPLVGWLAAACHATLAVPFAIAQAPVHDVALVPMVNVAVLALWNMDLRQGERGAFLVWTIVAGVALGASVLAKGLMGVAVAGLAHVAMLLVSRRVTGRLIGGGCAALAIAALVAAPWYLAMETREPGYLAYYFGARHLLGFIGDSQPHATRPLWFYVPVIGAGALPWILYISRPGSAASPAERRATTLLWCWCIASLALLTAAGSKLMTYALPVFPALAIMAARTWARALEDPAAAAGWLTTRMRAHALLFASGAAAFPWAAGHIGGAAASATAWIVLLALSAGWLCVLVFTRGASPRAWLSIAAGTGATYAAALILLGAPIAHAHSGRDLALHLNEAVVLPENVLVVGDRVGSVVFYLRPELRRTLRASQLQSVAPAAAVGLAASAELIAAPAGLRNRLVHTLSGWIGGETAAGRYVVFRPREVDDPLAD